MAESKTYKVLPGVRKTLERLHDDGYLLGLTTGGVEAAAHIKLARADLNHYFSFGGYGSDSPDRAELTTLAVEKAARLHDPLTPDQVYVVGDTPRDIAAAKAAGAISVGVASGHYSTAELGEAGAIHVLGSLEDPFPGL